MTDDSVCLCIDTGFILTVDINVTDYCLNIADMRRCLVST